MTRTGAAASRFLFVDNLRWTMILLVLSMHSADTYSTMGNWYYQEKREIGVPGLLAFWTYQSFLQAFFMGLLFFFAGYFVPGAYDRKGPSRFLRDRAIRLGVPTLLYVFIVGPLTEYFISKSWRPNPRISFLNEWTVYIVRLRFPGGTGPMWFCAALLVFCTVYALARLLFRSERSTPVRSETLDNRQIVAFTLIMAVATFVVRLVQPSNTSFYNMHLADFSQYVLLFVAGIAAYRRRWLETMSPRFGIRWMQRALGIGLPLWVLLITFGGARQHDTRSYGGGLYWQSATMNLWESLVCVGMILGLTVIYRDRFNTQTRLSRYLADNAFAVYLFHPPILIAIALAIHGIAMALALKFIVLTILSALASFALSGALFRRTPLLREVL